MISISMWDSTVMDSLLYEEHMDSIKFSPSNVLTSQKKKQEAVVTMNM